MTGYYLLVLLSALMFSVQFLCQKKYEEHSGNTVTAALNYSVYKGFIVMALMLILNRFHLEFTHFSFYLAGVYALCYILLNYFSFKAFFYANLSVYSVFSMLGGMILPFLCGVWLFHEAVTPFKLVCCLLVTVSVLLNLQKGKGSKKAFFYYMLVFLINGTIGALAAIHQNMGFSHVNSACFMFYSGVWTVVISLLWLMLKKEKLPLFDRKNLLYSFGDGFLNGMGDYILLLTVAPGALDASTQYPFLTGGVIVFSTVITALRKEKVRKAEYVAMVIAFIASILMAV